MDGVPSWDSELFGPIPSPGGNMLEASNAFASLGYPALTYSMLWHALSGSILCPVVVCEGIKWLFWGILV